MKFGHITYFMVIYNFIPKKIIVLNFPPISPIFRNSGISAIMDHGLNILICHLVTYSVSKGHTASSMGS